MKIAFLVIVSCIGQALAQSTLGRAEQEQFLRTAKIVDIRGTKKGITGSKRATLTDGRITHAAHIQTVDIHMAEFKTQRGVELNFKDSYKFNIAAYRVDKLLDLNMVPVSVERVVSGSPAAVTWWIDDVIGDEIERKKKHITPPDVAAFNDQMYTQRVFTALINNTDPNLGNFLTDKNWDLWMVDFTRAFREMDRLREPGGLIKCDRNMLVRMRELNEDVLQRELSPYATPREIKALLVRRDKIVKLFDNRVAVQGEAAVLCDLRRHTQQAVTAAAATH